MADQLEPLLLHDAFKNFLPPFFTKLLVGLDIDVLHALELFENLFFESLDDILEGLDLALMQLLLSQLLHIFVRLVWESRCLEVFIIFLSLEIERLLLLLMRLNLNLLLLNRGSHRALNGIDHGWRLKFLNLLFNWRHI